MDKDVKGYATKPATPTMEAFADYLIEEVFGGTLPAGVDVESFRRGVALGGSTRIYFQKSDSWKNDRRNYLAGVDSNRVERAREAAERAERAEKVAAERKAKTDAALAAALAAEAAKLAEADADVEEEDAEDAA